MMQFKAKFPGDCHACKGRIRRGDLITGDRRLGYVHADCHKPAAEPDLAQRFDMDYETGVCYKLDAPVSAYLSPKLKRATQHALEVALDTLRPDCVALVDAFDFPDSVLNSTIGRKDGNVYTPPPLASIPLLCSNDPPLTQVRGTV